MSKDPHEYLRHILDECNFLLQLSEYGLSKEELLNDETKKRAVVRSLEIIGEATKKIPVDFKLKWTSVNWREMAGMRDRLIHEYMGVNYHIVWDVVMNKIPKLKLQIQEILPS
ncbi:MAG: DUF86 domain-containing protein [Crocinitomicaceae bacterium]|nr:DUF86 domain-containing protein [Crocinitomicaceae bacterium]MBK8926447.1 DUF86 domain-containing protein [Crocinitomicaceae bacterium]